MADAAIGLALKEARRAFRLEEPEDEEALIEIENEAAERLVQESIENMADAITPIVNLSAFVNKRGWGSPLETIADDAMSTPIPFSSTQDAIYKWYKTGDISELDAMTKEIPMFGTILYNTIEHIQNNN